MGQGQSSIPDDELRALLAFYDALEGDRWRRRDGWRQPTIDPESWYGVEVMMGHVVSIELPANELCGRIPDSIERLTCLRVLDLSKNKLRGRCVCGLFHARAITDGEGGACSYMWRSVSSHYRRRHPRESWSHSWLATTGSELQ